MEPKIVGVCYHGDSAGNPYPAMKAAGIGWVRMDIAFPFVDALNGQLSAAYQANRAEMRRAAGNGVRVLGILPQWGHRSFDPRAGQNLWQDAFPAWMGTPNDEVFYEKFATVAEFIARDLGDRVGGTWQIGNEPDTATFRGPYSLDQSVRFAFAGARGIKRARPGDRCGINPAELSEPSRDLLRLAYAANSPLDYAGIDGYFGSWIPGEVTDWVPAIDEVAALTGRPVIVAEWGYSSLGKILEFDADLMARFSNLSEDERAAESAKYGEAALGLPPGMNPFCFWKGWANSCGGAHDEPTQADYVARGLQIFAGHPRVLGSFLYCWRDSDACYHCGQPDCPAECGWGLVRADETPKPALAAFRLAVERYYQPG